MKSWVHYECRCDPAELVHAITECGRPHGLESSCVHESPDCYAIRSLQTRPWLTVLWLGLPQDVKWLIRTSDGRSALFYDRRQAPWARKLSRYSLFSATLLLCLAFYGQAGPEAAFFLRVVQLQILSFFLSCLLIAISVRSVLEGRRFQEYLEAVQSTLNTKGGCLEEQPNEFVSRRTTLLVRYVGHFVLAATIAIGFGVCTQSERIPVEPWSAGLLVLLLLAGLMLGVFLLVARKMSANYRGYLLLPQMLCLLAVVPWALAVAPWYLCSSRMDDVRHVAFCFRTLESHEDAIIHAVEDKPALLAAMKSGKLNQMRAIFTVACALCTGFTISLVGAAIKLVADALILAVRIQPDLLRTRFHARSAAAARTATGDGLLPWLRCCIGGAAGLLAVLALAAAWNSLAIGLFAWNGIKIPCYPGGLQRVIDMSVILSLAALSQPDTSIAAAIVFRVVWLIYCFVLPFFWLLSVGSFVHVRLKTRRRLLAHEVKGNSLPMQVVDVIRELSGRSERPPRVAVTHSTGYSPMSHVYGVVHPECWIEIPDRLLQLFQRSNRRALLRAVLAHELAHHQLRHCTRANLWRAVGRVLLLGDGFVQSLIDSYRQEQDADRVAVSHFAVEPKHLIAALWLTTNSMAADIVSTGASSAGIGFVSNRTTLYGKMLTAGWRGLSRMDRWRLSLWCFLGLYTGGDRMAYWHPHTDERVKTIRSY